MLNVNGIEHSVTAEADTPLLYILRAARSMAAGAPR